MKDPTDRDKLMERTRAAVTYSNTHNDAGSDLNAFMALFHPDAKPETVLGLVADAREQQRKRR